jgi:hypothetical protein
LAKLLLWAVREYDDVEPIILAGLIEKNRKIFSAVNKFKYTNKQETKVMK